jgi:hypothetical protein
MRDVRHEQMATTLPRQLNERLQAEFIGQRQVHADACSRFDHGMSRQPSRDRQRRIDSFGMRDCASYAPQSLA